MATTPRDNVDTLGSVMCMAGSLQQNHSYLSARPDWETPDGKQKDQVDNRSGFLPRDELGGSSFFDIILELEMAFCVCRLLFN